MGDCLIQRILRRLLIYWRILVLKVQYAVFGIEAVNEALLRTTIGADRILRSFGAAVGKGAVIHSPLVIHNAEHDYSNIQFGSHVHVGRGVFLDLTNSITVGDDAVISMNCSLLTHQDVGDRPLHIMYPRMACPLHIGQAAYLGAGAILMARANIGEATVVGAGAVVTGPVTDHEVVVGVPARMIKSLSDKVKVT